MNAWLACGWGALGGLVVELLQLYRSVQRAGALPWKKDPEHEPHPPALIVAALLRIGIGAVIAAAMAQGHQISGALGALGAGVAAPLIIDQLGQSGLPDQSPQPAKPGQAGLSPAPDPAGEADG